MKLYRLYLPALSLVMLTAFSPRGIAAVRSSTNYSVEGEALDGGGGSRQSSNYGSVEALESMPIGNSASAGYKNSGGCIAQFSALLTEGSSLEYAGYSPALDSGSSGSNQDDPTVDQSLPDATNSQSSRDQLASSVPSALEGLSAQPVGALPQLTISLGSDGTLHLAVQGKAGVAYRIETTEDLMTAEWLSAPAAKVADARGWAVWTEPASSLRPYRFYRVVQIDSTAASEVQGVVK